MPGIRGRLRSAMITGAVVAGAGMVLADSSHENQAGRCGVPGWPYGRSDYYGLA
jgi:hypothetical protein